MAIDPKTLCRVSREIITESDPAAEVSYERLHALIQPALSEWLRRVKKDPERQKNFMAETASISIVNGIADLTSQLDAVGMPAENVKKSEIYIRYGAPLDRPGYSFIREFLVQKGGNDTTVVRPSFPSDEDFISAGDIGRRAIIELDGVVLADSRIVSINYQFQSFVIADAIEEAFVGATCRIYSNKTYTLAKTLADTWSADNSSVWAADAAAGDIAIGDVGKRFLATSAAGAVVHDDIIASRASDDQFSSESAAAGTFESNNVITVYDSAPASSESDFQVAFVNSRDRLILGGRQDRHFITAYFDGKKMYLRDPDAASGNPLTSFNGSMTVRGIVVPTALTNVPAGLVGDLAIVLAEMATMLDKPAVTPKTGIEEWQRRS